jgi:TolB-like protein
MKEETLLSIRPPVVRLFPVVAYTAMMMALATAATGYQQQMQTAAGTIGGSMTKTSKKSVAVVDFTDLQGNATELGRFLAEQLSVALSTAGGAYEVIDRNHLRAILQEHKLSATGLIDPQTARKVGQMAGAECLVSGSITPFSESVNLSIKLLDTNTAKILGGVTVEIPRTSTINELLARGIGTQLVSETASPTSRAPASSGTAKGSPATGLAYGVEVSINECKKEDRMVTCQGTLRNGTDATVHVNFIAFGGAEAIDNLGNRSGGRAVFSSGGGDWYLDLEPDLPVKFWINNAKVSADATSLTTRIFITVSGGSGGGGEKVVVLRNIPLQ